MRSPDFINYPIAFSLLQEAEKGDHWAALGDLQSMTAAIKPSMALVLAGGSLKGRGVEEMGSLRQIVVSLEVTSYACSHPPVPAAAGPTDMEAVDPAT